MTHCKSWVLAQFLSLGNISSDLFKAIPGCQQTADVFLLSWEREDGELHMGKESFENCHIKMFFCILRWDETLTLWTSPSSQSNLNLLENSLTFCTCISLRSSMSYNLNGFFFSCGHLTSECFKLFKMIFVYTVVYHSCCQRVSVPYLTLLNCLIVMTEPTCSRDQTGKWQMLSHVKLIYVCDACGVDLPCPHAGHARNSAVIEAAGGFVYIRK